MTTITAYKELRPDDIRQLTIEAAQEFITLQDWPQTVIDQMPAEYLKKIMADIAGLESTLQHQKRMAAEMAMHVYGISARQAAVHASISQNTTALWKREPLTFEMD